MAALVFALAALRCWRSVVGAGRNFSPRCRGPLHAVADLRRARAASSACARNPRHPSNPKSTPGPRLDPRPSPPQTEPIITLRHQILDQQLRTNPTRKEEEKEARAELTIPGLSSPLESAPPMTCTVCRCHSSRQRGPGAPRIGFPRPGDGPQRGSTTRGCQRGVSKRCEEVPLFKPAAYVITGATCD